MPPLRLAWFLHLADRPAIRDAMMLQLAFGPVVGEAAHDDAIGDGGEGGRGTGRRSTSSCGVSSPRARRTTMSRAPRRGCCSARRASGPSIGAFAVPSIWCAGLPRNAPAGYRAAPLCMAAWLAWALGMGSAAGMLVDQAVASEPGHSMATLLSAFIGSGALPEWAFVRAIRGTSSVRQ